MTSTPTTPETVLRLLRQLPPRERLHMVNQILPELEQDLPVLESSADFWRNADLQTLAEEQGVYAVDNFQSLLGGWPDDEVIDDFIATVHEERQRHGRPISAQDAWIAATAIRHQIPLATHKREDFAGITGLTLLV